MSEQVREIDLLELFYKIILLIKSNIKSFLIFSIIGGLLGAGYYFVSTEKYEQVLIGYSPVVSIDVLQETIKDINNHSYIDSLKGSDTLLKNILVNIYSIQTEKLSEEGEKKLLKITFKSRKTYNKETLINIIDNCLQKSDYINASIEEAKNRYTQIISFLEVEIEKKKEASEITDKKSGDIYVNNNETASSLFIQKKAYEKELFFSRPIVITKATDIGIHKKKSLIISIFISVFLSLILTFSALLLIKIFKYVNKSMPKALSN